MYLHNIDSSKNTIIEDYIKDTDYIYNNYSTIDNTSGYVTREELADRSYTRSIYINTAIQEGVMCLDSSGMVTTAKYKPNIRAKEIITRTESLDRTNTETLTKGIYIVREWYIKTFRGMLEYCNVSLLEYYNNIEAYVKLPDSELTILKQKLSEMYRDNGRWGGTNNIKIRSISFIPLDKLHTHKAVYDRHTDLVFTIGTIDTTVVHPRSRVSDMREMNIKPTDLDVNVIEVEVIDNFSVGKRYYSMFGNQAVTLVSRPDAVKEDGITVHVTNGGRRRHGYTVSEEEYESVGIYDDISKARNEGDLKNGLELTKLNLEYTKVEQQVKALEHEKFKMEEEKTAITNKYAHELDIANLKLRTSVFEYHKLTKMAIVDAKTKILDLKLKQSNHMTGRMNDAIKHDREITMMAYKHRMDVDKNKTKTYGSIVDSVLKYGSMLLK